MYNGYGHFNIDGMNTNGSERNRFCNILETLRSLQNICTHKSSLT